MLLFLSPKRNKIKEKSNVIVMTHGDPCTCDLKSKEQVEYYKATLEKIPSLSPSQRRRLFQKADTCFIKFVGECCKTVLCDITKLPDTVFKKLKKQKDIKKHLRFLSNKSNSIKKKRQLIIKKGGGFLSLILPAIASSLLGWAADAAIKHFQG